MNEAILNNLDQAMRDDDLATVATLLDEHPDLISTPVRSRNWGPPLSHAANLGKLNIVAALLRRNPADVEHAFGRACLQGQLAVARYLLAQRPALARSTAASTAARRLSARRCCISVRSSAPWRKRGCS